MKILVANIGSTSFKYRLYDMPGETLLARGGVERIGAANSRSYVFIGQTQAEKTAPVPDHGKALAACLEQLTDALTGCLKDAAELAAVGFKAVHAQNVSGVQLVDDQVLSAMDAFDDVAPAHNPPYSKAMRQLRAMFPALPLVAAFETGFHETISPADKHYAIPREWSEKLGIKRWGFHGASHRYIGGRIAELTGRNDLKVISCHLGGSSSICAITNGKSVGCSLGMSPQSGLPHNNRVGDFDAFALPVIMKQTGKSLDEVLKILANESGLAGIGGAGNDLRDIEAAADRGDQRAELALGVFVAAIRDFIGTYLVRLGGADAIAFTGGIGENSARLREAVCKDLDWFGIELDRTKNQTAKGEVVISSESSRTQLWTVPTNEEIVVARQTFAKLAA